MFNTIIRTFYNNTKILLGDDVLLVLYWDGNNWGDALNPMLIQKISGKHPLLVTRFTLNITDKPVFSVIGSILGNTRGGKNLVIWGTGFISNKGRLRVRPKQIYAVRGPLTRELILKQGFECPKIYGDPALLYPRFYRQDIPKKYKLGIIPHFIDKNDTRLHDVQQNADVIIIDIQGGIHEVVDNICSCKNIASSSLHGIIAADAYGIPSTWIKLSDGVRGEGFKFFDYFCSVEILN